MHAPLAKSRYLLAPLTAMGLVLGGWMAAPAMAATGSLPARQCCHKAAPQCCEGTCCHTPAHHPRQVPADPLAFNEGPQDGKYGLTGFTLPSAAQAPRATRDSCLLATSDFSDFSLIAQHVRLQI